MNVNELYWLTKWVEDNISETGIQKLYTQFHAVLQQNTQANQQKAPFDTQKDELFTALLEIPLEQLTDAQNKVLETIGVYQNIGAIGVGNIEDVLSRHAIDIATAEQKVATAMHSVQEAISWSEQTKGQLQPIVDIDLQPPLSENEILIRIRFAESARISNVEELKEWSKIWWQIVRGITMLHGKPPESVKIIGASKGSILIDVIGYAAFARILLSVVNKSLEAAERFQNLRLVKQQITAAKLDNDAAERSFTAAIEAERETKIAAITDGVLKNIEAHSGADGDVVNGLKNSIEQLISFLEKGGHIDFILPPSPEDGGQEAVAEPQEIQELRQMTEKVRLLEQKVKLLENNSDL